MTFFSFLKTKVARPNDAINGNIELTSVWYVMLNIYLGFQPAKQKLITFKRLPELKQQKPSSKGEEAKVTWVQQCSTSDYYYKEYKNNPE